MDIQIFKKHQFREKVVITPQSSHLPLSNSWGTLARTYLPQRDQCAVLTSPCELSMATHQPPIKGYRQVFPDNIYCTPAMCRHPISDRHPIVNKTNTALPPRGISTMIEAAQAAWQHPQANEPTPHSSDLSAQHEKPLESPPNPPFQSAPPPTYTWSELPRHS